MPAARYRHAVAVTLLGMLQFIPIARAQQETSDPTPSTAAPAQPPRQLKRQPLFDGKSLKNWRVVNEFDFSRHGKVSVENGTLQLASGQPGTAISWKGAFPRDHYEIRLEAMRYEGDDFFCGMTFPVGPQYCTLIIGGWGGTLIGLSNIDGQAADENETTLSERFEKGRWYRVKLRVTPEAIQVSLDGEQIIDVKRKDREFSIWWEQEPVRPFGIATWRTGARLRNITLTKLAHE